MRLSYKNPNDSFQNIIYSDLTNSYDGWFHAGNVTSELINGTLKVDVDGAWEGVQHQLNNMAVAPGDVLKVKLIFDKGNTDSTMRLYFQELDANGNHLSWNTLNGNLLSGTYEYTYTVNTGNKLILRIDKDDTNTSTLTSFYIDYVSVTSGELEIVEENNYYPFGLKHKGYNTNITSTNIALKRKFGGKEYQDELGLDWYDITARNYDPALGRWMNIDPLAEKPHQISHSPYQAMLNNPILYIDPDGMEVKNGEAGNLQQSEDNLELAKSNYENETGKTYEKKSKDDFETNKEWRNHKKETKEVRKAEKDLNKAKERFDLVKNVIKDFADVDKTNFDKLNTLKTNDHLGNEISVDVIVTVGNANMHGGAKNWVGKNEGSITMYREAGIVISPKYLLGSDTFAHEGGHIFGAAKDFVRYWNNDLPKDFRSCQDPNLKTHPRVSMALEWQKSYNNNKN